MMASVLNCEVYAEAEAARLLRVSQSTLNYWLEGGERRGRLYEPIIRDEPKGGHPPVTWAEFIECGWLRQYRRHSRVPMLELRRFIRRLRDDFGVPYPLAHFEPFANQGKLLVLEQAQEATGLDPDYCLVAPVNGQLVLTEPSGAYLQRVEWNEQGAAVAWLPHELESPVRIRPDVRFGRPSVGGISTEVLWEQFDAGADAGEVAEDFDLTQRQVQWAISYEMATRAA